MPKAVDMTFTFPHEHVEMAQITFSIELSDADNIRWDDTKRGLLKFFAMCSHDVYLKLAAEIDALGARDRANELFGIGTYEAG